MTYIEEVLKAVIDRNPGEEEFIQATKEVFEAIALVVEENED